MSARIQNLSIVVAGALAVACSKPSERGAQTADQTTTTQVPTLATPAGGDQSLVSAIETSEHSELKLVRPAERKPPQPVVVSQKGQSTGGEAQAQHNHALDLGTVTPNVTAASQAPSTDTPIAMAMAPLPSGPSPSQGEGQGTGEGHGGRGTLWQPDPPSPTIIIRGGMGGIDDDCKRHPQGYPIGGIAINSRLPAIGAHGGLASNPARRPFTPGIISGPRVRGGIR
jgi:hypothetical protein